MRNVTGSFADLKADVDCKIYAGHYDEVYRGLDDFRCSIPDKEEVPAFVLSCNWDWIQVCQNDEVVVYIDEVSYKVDA